MTKRTEPLKLEHYHPREYPTRYPLELNFEKSFTICLWWADGENKCTIALWDRKKESYELRFIGDRPLDDRVYWGALRELIEQGQAMLDRLFYDEENPDVF